MTRTRDGKVGAHNAAAAMRGKRDAATLRPLVVVLAALCCFYVDPLARGQSQPEPKLQAGAESGALQDIQTRNRRVVVLFQRGQYAEALELAQQTLTLVERALGPEHADTAASLNNLGGLYLTLGHYEQALPLLQRALAIREKALGSEHPDTATSVNNLGYLYRAMGQYEQALPLHQRALAIRGEALGPEHPATAASFTNLADLYQAMGHYEQALPLYQRALAIREKVLGLEHPDTAKSVNNLGYLRDKMGHYEQALPLYKRALAINEEALGVEHPDTAISLNNLGSLYQVMGRYEQALPLFQRALAITEKAFGAEHPDTARSLNNLGTLYNLMAQHEQALLLYTRALAIHEKALGPEHPDTVQILDSLGGAYQAMGQYEKALPLSERALAIREKVLGPEHPDMALSVSSLGALYEATGRYQQALPLLQKALAIREKALGSEHPDTALSANNLGALYRALGQYQQALPLYQRAFAIGLMLPTPAERSVYSANLCAVYGDQKHFALATFYCKLAVNQYQQLRQGARGLEETLQRSLTARGEPTYRELAKLLIEQGRIAEAEQVLGMLKEYEYFEFVRRSQARDTRTTLSDFTAEEKLLADRLEQSARELTRIYAERETLRTLKSPSVEQQQRLTLLDAQLQLENENLGRLFAQIKTQLAEQARPTQAARAESLVQGKGATQGMLQSLRQMSSEIPALIYILPEEKTTLFIIHTQEGLRQVQGGLGEQALNERIGELRQAIERRDTSYVTSASELYESLIGPVESYLAESRVDILMLYLTDALRYVPFAALYDKKTGRHLTEKYASAVYTHVGRETLRDAPHEQWSAVGLGTSQKTPNHASLPAVETELKRVVRDPSDTPPLGTLPGKRYLNNEFNETLFAKLTRGDESPPVMHVATHFVLAAGNDQDSALILGNGDQITLAQISANAQLSGYDLITLSACETALGGGKTKDKPPGAEVEGLGAVLQKQGAKGVLATLWKVEDTGTALLMEQFYKARGEKRQTTKAQALQQAQRALLSGAVKADDPKKHDLRHPYYWAPFILMGNWL